MRIAAVASALPENVVTQAQCRARLEQVWRDHPEVQRRLASLHANTRVEKRHMALPLEAYGQVASFGEFNDHWIRTALELGERAVRAALARAGLAARDVDAIFFTTVTGVASPSIDARLCNRLGLRSDVKRTPLFGLGCVAGVSAVARAADFLRGAPDSVAVVLSVELCTLTFQRGDISLPHLISAGLFGDGACAAVLVGANREQPLANGPRIAATRSVFYPDTEDVMGWRVSEQGFHIVLSTAVPSIAREHVGRDVDRFLGEHRLVRGDIAAWIAHPGGPKVLAAVRDALGLSDEDLRLSWESLASVGNLSSASVLLVLEATLARRPPAPGALGVMLALGPGFCAEYLLLEW
jgi:alkylresorcinol/alkylpyrone synthase